MMKYDEGEIDLGERQTYGGGRSSFRLSHRDRLQHVYVIGKTGAGKSTLLRHLILQDLEQGRGVALIDPHGDLAEELLDYIPPWRSDHLVYFNPADTENPIGFNVLDQRDTPDHLAASAIISPLKGLWGDSWGPRMEHILRNALLTLLAEGNSSLLGINRLLSDETYRKRVVARLKDPLLRAFWEREFDAFDQRFRVEAIAPIQNKIGAFLATPLLRNILGQVRSTIDLRFMLDDSRILIANLGKGRIGETESNLLGSLLVSRFHLAAMGRADLEETARRPFYLFVDEFHSFTTETFASALSESRKYGLALTLAHQYLDQMDEQVCQAVLGNVGTLCAFRVGNKDAAFLADEFTPWQPDTLTDLERHHTLLRPLVKGSPTEAFRLSTRSPGGKRYGRGEKLRALSRERFGRPRARVEDKIGRWIKKADPS